MPFLNRAPNEKELEYLIRLFLRAETSIINEIGRLRSQGLVDYHAVAFSYMFSRNGLVRCAFGKAAFCAVCKREIENERNPTA